MCVCGLFAQREYSVKNKGGLSWKQPQKIPVQPQITPGALLASVSARTHTAVLESWNLRGGGGKRQRVCSSNERRGDKWRHSCYRCKTLWLSLRYGLRNARVSATLEHGTTEAATAALSLLRHIDPGSPCAQPSGEKCSTRRAAPASHLPCRHGGGRGGHAAARAHQYGWVAALRAATRTPTPRRPSGPAARPGGHH